MISFRKQSKNNSIIDSNKFEIVKRDIEKRYLLLINTYLFFIGSFSLFQTVLTIYFKNFELFYYLLSLTILSFAVLLLPIKRNLKNKKQFKILIFSGFILFTFIITYFHIYTHRIAGFEYFYFSLIFGISFFFGHDRDMKWIVPVIIFICINFFATQLFSFNSIPRISVMTVKDLKMLKFCNSIFAVVITFMHAYLISTKVKSAVNLMVDTNTKDLTILDLLKTNDDLLKQQIINNNLSEENIKEIVDLAEENSPLFMEKFQIYFPDFMGDILKINSELIFSELQLCALMRLNFDTKKIASCTNSTVRSIESRKYRLRKKLHISPVENFNNFILKI